MVKLLNVTPIGVYALPVATLGENISRLRQREGFALTRRKFAKKIGTEYQSVYDWESDRRKSVDLMTLFRLAKGLEVTIEDLVAGLDGEYDRLRRDLIGHSAGTGSAASTGGDADVPASDRDRAEARRIEAEYREIVAATEEVAHRLFNIATEHRERFGGKARTPGKAPSGVRRGRRKTG